MCVCVHRTPSWNFAPNPDKQWLLQYTGKMTTKQIAFTDILQTKRLQTLQSVDDAVEKVTDIFILFNKDLKLQFCYLFLMRKMNCLLRII
jgi:hypothetical protein